MPDKTRKLIGGKLPLGIELVPSTPSGNFSGETLAPLKVTAHGRTQRCSPATLAEIVKRL